jgi:hypothetical protein
LVRAIGANQGLLLKIRIVSGVGVPAIADIASPALAQESGPLVCGRLGDFVLIEFVEAGSAEQ